eukprot:96236-Rhodomonas_salina.2
MLHGDTRWCWWEQENRRKTVETIAGAVWSFESAVQKERRHRQAVAWAQRLLAFHTSDAGQAVAAAQPALPGSGSHAAQAPRSPGGRPLSGEEQFDGVSLVGRQPSVELHAQRRKVRRASIVSSEGKGVGDDHSGSGTGKVRRWMLDSSSKRMSEVADEGHHQPSVSPCPSPERRRLQGVVPPQKFFGDKAGKEVGSGSENGGKNSGGEERMEERGKFLAEEERLDEMLAAVSSLCDTAVKKATSLAFREVRAGVTGLIRGMMQESAVSPLPSLVDKEEEDDSGRLMSATRMLRHDSSDHAAGVKGNIYHLSVGGRAREMRSRCDTVQPGRGGDSLSPMSSPLGGRELKAVGEERFRASAAEHSAGDPAPSPVLQTGRQLQVKRVRRASGGESEAANGAQVTEDAPTVRTGDTGAGVQEREGAANTGAGEQDSEGDVGGVEISMIGEPKTLDHEC